jgi:hypothetical protein
LASVSICIPVYNGARYLQAALDSARAQDHGELEILVVDDGSSDDSVAMALAAAAQDGRIRCVRNPANLGLVGNWNRCVELAQGDWVKFLFQDDLLAPGCLAALLAKGQQGFAFVACDRDFIFEGDDATASAAGFIDNRRQVNAFLRPNAGCSAGQYAEQALRGLHFNLVGEPTVTLIQRALLQSTGPFNAGLAQLCDTEYWLRLGCQVGVGYVPEPLASFRVHAEATTARNRRDASFVADSLDKLALAYTAARAPECEALRQAARAATPAVDLEAAFRQRAHQVREWVQQHAAEPCGRGTVDEAYRGFLQRSPGCTVSPAAHAAWRLRKRLWTLRHGSTA